MDEPYKPVKGKWMRNMETGTVNPFIPGTYWDIANVGVFKACDADGKILNIQPLPPEPEVPADIANHPMFKQAQAVHSEQMSEVENQRGRIEVLNSELHVAFSAAKAEIAALKQELSELLKKVNVKPETEPEADEPTGVEPVEPAKAKTKKG